MTEEAITVVDICGNVHTSKTEKEPIIEFTDESQAYECLKEWQERLFLTDWVISVALVDKCEDINGKNCIATNVHNHDCKDCHIELEIFTDEHKTHHTKLSHEQSLVHELLHCNYCWFRYDETDADGCLLNLHHHQLLEQMAKSLIMSKYNLTFDWFKNF